jgi:sensor c-di-GMP phosphodiesterase-like protein
MVDMSSRRRGGALRISTADGTMRRWRLFLLAMVGALCCAAAAFVLAALVTWSLAISAQKSQVAADAEMALEHVSRVYAEAAAVLRQIAAVNSAPCSPANIREMLQLTEGSPVVVNVAYGSGDVVECNSWGPLTFVLKKAKATEHLEDGTGVTVNWRPQSLSPERSMLILQRGGYAVLLDQRIFYRDWGGSDGSALESVALASGTPLLASYAQRVSPRAAAGDVVRTSLAADGWAVTVSQTPITFMGYLRSQRTLLVPLAVVLALLFGLLALLWLRQRLSIAGEFRAAVRRGEIAAHYQPVVDLATGACVGAEALARWRGPDGSPVSPDIFIPMAERAGLIGKVRAQIVAAIVRDLGRWLKSNAEVHISVNLSASELTSDSILHEFEEAFRQSGIDCRQIWLEVTETGIIDMAEARPTLVELGRRGHRLAIDDFGTGYSGLSYLQQLQVDILKVDRCFVEVIGSDAATRDVTALVIDLAHQLDLAVVAEGVETETQANYLRERGVAYAQGWLFARALPADAFLVFWSNQPRRADQP